MKLNKMMENQTEKQGFSFLSTLRAKRFNPKLYLALILFTVTIIACRSVPTTKPSTPKPNTFALHKKHDLWYDLRKQFQLANKTKHARVKQQIAWYVRHPKYLQRMLNQAAPYLYYIEHRVTTRNLPGELALVPIIESEYDPFTYSRVGASGLWQIMPETGSGFGLKQNWWYDGRRDIYASTRAALDYLTHLNSFFNGDWLLAMAAYDAGEGKVQRAINSNKQQGLATDYWSLSLPQETNLYVPRLLALSVIVSDPERYGFTLPNIVNRPYFDQVDVGFQIDLTKAAKLAGINVTEMYKLNPGYDHWATDPKGPHVLVLPIDKINQFKQNLAVAPIKKVAPSPDVSKQLVAAVKSTKQISQRDKKGMPLKNIVVAETPAQHYTVKHGDTLLSITHKLHVKLEQLRRWNNLAQKDNKLRPGQRLSYYS